MDAAGKSDIGVVPGNVPNNAGRPLPAMGTRRNRKGGDGNPPPTLDGIARLARRRRHGRRGRPPCLPFFWRGAGTGTRPYASRPRTGHRAGVVRRLGWTGYVCPTSLPKVRAV
jgi:hypothetical protein